MPKTWCFSVWSIRVMDHHDMILIDRGVPPNRFCSTLSGIRLVITPVWSQTDPSRVLLTFGIGLPSMLNSLTALHPQLHMLRHLSGYHHLSFATFGSLAAFVERSHVLFSFPVVLALRTPAWKPALWALLSNSVISCKGCVTSLSSISRFSMKPVNRLTMHWTAAISNCNCLSQLFCLFLIVHQIIWNNVLFNLSTCPFALGWYSVVSFFSQSLTSHKAVWTAGCWN